MFPAPAQDCQILLKQWCYASMQGKRRQRGLSLSFKTNSLWRTEKQHFPVLLFLMYLKKVSLDVFWKLLLISCWSSAAVSWSSLALCQAPAWHSIPVQVSAIQALLCSSHWVSSYLPYLPETRLLCFLYLSFIKAQSGLQESPVFFYSTSVVRGSS